MGANKHEHKLTLQLLKESLLKEASASNPVRKPEHWEYPNHKLYLHYSDQPGAILVPQSLLEDNYSEWCHSMTMALTIKNKVGFVNGSSPRPTVQDNEQQQWDRCTETVTTFFNKLKGLWDEKNALCGLSTCGCEEGIKVTNYIKTQKTMQFLMGLNDNFALIRGSIVAINPLPTVNKVFAKALRHEKQAEAMTDSK
ncbi:hypothetical protein ACLB2K_073926 [Fragaria x ananassa]